MDCPECGSEMVVFAVPSDLREVGPGSEVAAICTGCLALVGIDDEGGAAVDPDFGRIIEAFPEGEAGAAMAIAVGLLAESLALNRQTVSELLERVRAEGADPWLVLERLDASPTVESDADLGRARVQLEQLLDS